MFCLDISANVTYLDGKIHKKQSKNKKNKKQRL